jgi:hypothetical protein
VQQPAYETVQIMRKSYSLRLHLMPDQAAEVKRLAAAEDRSQAEILSHLVRDGLRFRQEREAEQAEVLRVGQSTILENTLVKLLRGEPDA